MSHRLEENPENGFRPAILSRIHEVHHLVSGLLSALERSASDEEIKKHALAIKGRVLISITNASFRLDHRNLDDQCALLHAFIRNHWVLEELVAAPNHSTWSIFCKWPTAEPDEMERLIPELRDHMPARDQDGAIHAVHIIFDDASIVISYEGVYEGVDKFSSRQIRLQIDKI